MAMAEWELRLRRGGYRITPQRQLVLEAVERLRHGTPEEILADNFELLVAADRRPPNPEIVRRLGEILGAGE